MQPGHLPESCPAETVVLERRLCLFTSGTGFGRLCMERSSYGLGGLGLESPSCGEGVRDGSVVVVIAVVHPASPASLVVAFPQHGGFGDGFTGVNIEQFECEQVIALVVAIAVGGAGGDAGEQQVVDGLTAFFQHHLEVALFLRQDEAVRIAAEFGHGGVDVTFADHAVLRVLADQCADVFVDLILEVADGFTALVFDSDKADGASEAAVFTNGCMGGLKDGLAGFSEQPGHGFIDEGLPCFSAGVVAADHVPIVLFENVGILFFAAAGCEDAAEQQRQE